MKTLRHQLLLPALFSAGSFLCLAVLVTSTSPVNNIAYAVFFFLALLVLLVSLGYFITLLQMGKVSRKSRGRIFSLSIFILILLMFRSAGSLNWTGGLILVLLVGGLLFYGSRRA